MADNFEARRRTLLDLVLLLIVSTASVFPFLGQNNHWASREIRHAEIIREMAESGDYLIPHLLGEPYCDKPPVMHVPAALLTRWLGEPSMWVARLPCAVAAILGVLATYGIGRLLRENLNEIELQWADAVERVPH